MNTRDTEVSLNIGQLVRRTGASARSVRHYDENGLLTSVRSDNGYRVFPEQAVTQVRQIQRLINTGLNLEQIRSFPDCMLMIAGAMDSPETPAAQRRRLASIEDQIEELEQRRARLLAMLGEGGGKTRR